MLSVEQTEYIISRVERENIHFSHLGWDLVDHICCDVEKEMERGIEFPEAIKRVEARIGNRGLKKIQEDTLYLIDKNYRIMKKLMKTTGVIGPALLGIGSLFKIFHWPGASIMLVLGFFVLCFMFFPASANVLYKESKNKYGIFLFVTGFLAVFTYSLGILFKVQHWPGAGMMILAGDIIGILVFLPALIIQRIRKSETKEKTPAYITGLVALMVYLTGVLFKMMHWPGATILLTIGSFVLYLVAIPLYCYYTFRKDNYIKGKYIFIVFAAIWFNITTALISIKVSGSIFNQYNIIYASASKNIEALQNDNLKYYNLFSDSIIKEGFSDIRTASQQLYSKIEEMKSNMILIANEGNIPEDRDNYFWHLQDPGTRKVSFMYMIGQQNNGKAYALKQSLLSYAELVANTFGYTNTVTSVSTSLKNEVSAPGWENKMFSTTLAFTIDYLTLLQQQVLIIESESYLNALKKQINLKK
ncbi:MAG: GldL-related protein [Bacteroidales bacterium]